jgi:hypothetical protein
VKLRLELLAPRGEHYLQTTTMSDWDEYYDIDFWVNQKSGKLEVDNVKVHKVPV